MPTTRFPFSKTLLAIAIASLSACGGGGGSSTSTSSGSGSGSGSGGSGSGGSGSGGTSPPVSSVPVSTSGIITGFGSIFVNGIRYDTSSAEVKFEEDTASKTEDDLRLGMRVAVSGTRTGDDRKAQVVRYDDDLKGPVDAIAPNAGNPSIGRLTMLGQTVVVDANTVFDDRVVDANADGIIDLRDLAPGATPVRIEVSGFATADGFLATRIEPADDAAGGAGGAANAEAELKGTITNLDTTAGTFKIGNLVVAYEPGDLDPVDFATRSIANGLFVEIKGLLLANGSLSATRIKLEDDLDDRFDDNGTEFELEGILQAVDTTADPDTVTINGRTVPVDDASRLAAFIGRKVEIEGVFNAAGVLVLRAGAAGVKLEIEQNIRVTDRVQTVGSTNFSTRLGVIITPTGNSRVEDDEDDGDRLTPAEFISRVRAGDLIEARGYTGADGNIVWTRVKREDDNEVGCELRGPVNNGSINNPTFEILGIAVDTSGITSNSGFRDQNGAVTDRAGFFAALTAGAVIDARSAETEAACSNDLLQAARVEFELDDDVYGSDDNDDDRDEDESDDESGDDDSGDDDSGDDDSDDDDSDDDDSDDDDSDDDDSDDDDSDDDNSGSDG
jgi:hypothetical protein